ESARRGLRGKAGKLLLWSRESPAERTSLLVARDGTTPHSTARQVAGNNTASRLRSNFRFVPGPDMLDRTGADRPGRGQSMSSEMNAWQFAQLAKELHDAGSTGQTAQQVVEFACKQLDSDHAGITLIRRG